MGAPRGRTYDKRPAASGPVACACPKCSARLRPDRAGRFLCSSCKVPLDLWMTAAAVRDRKPDALPPSLPAAASDDQPPCVAHPQNASTVACSRCGDFICEVCRIRIEGMDLCPRCFERGIDKAELVTVRRQFRSPQMSLGLALLSIPAICVVSYFAVFVALAAVAVGIQALVKINRQPSLGGKGKAIAGIVVGSSLFLLYVSLIVMLILGMTQPRWAR